MAPEATKPTGKAGTPQKDDAPEVKGPLSVLSDREKEIMLQCMLTVKGLSAASGIDTTTAAERLGFTNTRSLTNAWANIKKKVTEWEKKDRRERGLPSEDEEADPAAVTTTSSGDDTTGGAKPTPKKRARTTSSAAAATKSATGTPRSRGRASATSTPRKKTGGKNTPANSPAGKNASLLDYFSPSKGQQEKEGGEGKGAGGGAAKADGDEDMFVSGDV